MNRLLLATASVLCATAAFAHTDVSVEQAKLMLATLDDVIVLDVREYSEFCGANLHIENAADLPWITGVLQARYTELASDATIIVVCASGNRSNLAATFLDDQGFTAVFDMLGGMAAWDGERESCDREMVLTMGMSEAGATIDWTPVEGTQDYDLLRGEVAELYEAAGFIELGPTECLSDDSPFTYHTDPEGLEGLHFYLARQKDATWGWSSSLLERRGMSLSCE